MGGSRSGGEAAASTPVPAMAADHLAAGEADLHAPQFAARQAQVEPEPAALAHGAFHVLRRLEFLALARGDPELAVRAECETVSVVAFARNLRRLLPDHLCIGK